MLTHAENFLEHAHNQKTCIYVLKIVTVRNQTIYFNLFLIVRATTNLRNVHQKEWPVLSVIYYQI